MTPEHMARLEQFWLRAYEYFGEQLPPHKCCWFAEDVKQYNPEILELAFEAYRLDSNRITAYKPQPPMPYDLIALLSQTVAPEHQANEMANNIYAAMNSVGYNKPDEAREQLGEVAWQVVQGMGGWTSLCQGTQVSRRENFIAQARDQALGVLARRKAQRVDLQVPHLIAGRDPQGVRAQGALASVGTIGRQLLERRPHGC